MLVADSIKAYAALEPTSQLVPYEYEAGELGATEVEIAVEYCGLCHSDLSMINNDWGASEYPLVPGHEVIGKVSQLGSQVNGFSLGEYVGLGWHSGYCLECYSCDHQEHNLCDSPTETIVGRHGGFADFVRAEQTSIVKLPEGLDRRMAGPLFCGGITVFTPLVDYEISRNAKVAVIGIGGLGHMAVQFLNAWGCDVTAMTSSPEKQAELESLGAHHVLDIKNDDELKKQRNQFDFILSTVNVKLNWNRLLDTLKPKGRLHFVGITMEPLDIAAIRLISKQRSVSGSPVGSPKTIKRMLDFVVEHNIQPQVEIFPFSEVNQAIEKLHNGEIQFRAVLSHHR